MHPPGADVSALEHLLRGAQTFRPERGLFLAYTWRLHPDVCAFTSEIFYESRLQSIDGLERQRVHGPEPLNGSGLRFLPVEHTGNTNESREEVAVVAALIEQLLASHATWVNAAGV